MVENLIYGPVPSRRLGLSLGIDLVPYKVCSYNCIYCQIGPTEHSTIKRSVHVTSESVLLQLTERLSEGIQPDYITLGGSGEPTLNSDIGNIIREIKKISDIPVAVLTNASLLSDSSVRNDILGADVVLPSFDACNEKIFSQLNRPHSDLNFAIMAEGLIEFRKVFSGGIWLEIFIVEGINDEDAIIKQYIKWIQKIKPNKIHLNTAVRPTAETSIQPLSEERLAHFCEILGDKAEVIASFIRKSGHGSVTDKKNTIIEMVSRRPCSIEDITAGLGLHKNEIIKFIEPMIKDGIIDILSIKGVNFYQKKGNVLSE